MTSVNGMQDLLYGNDADRNRTQGFLKMVLRDFLKWKYIPN
jgi:hypothetical protein